MRNVLVIALIASVIAGCGDKENNKVSKTLSGECTKDTVITGLEYRPLRQAELYESRSLSGQKVINEKATKILGTVNYKTVDASTRVVEECTVGGSSFVRVIDPEWLKDNKGWISESVLKQKNNPGDKYEGLIAEYVVEELPSDYFAGDKSKFKPVAKLILKSQVAAAQQAIDSGSCDYVENVIFQARNSSLKKFNYIVDCSNKKRFEISSDDLKNRNFKPVSNTDKAIGQSQAIEQCKYLIASNVVNPSTLNFKEILDMSYYKAETTGNVRLVLGFEAKNKLGQSQDYRAICIFPPSGKGEITISQN